MPKNITAVHEQGEETPDHYLLELKCDVCLKPWHGSGETLREIQDAAREDRWTLDGTKVLCEAHSTHGIRVY